MANELQPLSQLFQNRLFRIPDYQRGYAWQQAQLADFWDDLINLQSDRYHYTGLLSLKNLKSKETKNWGNDLWLVENGFRPCHIVDGQQRLTTFIILVNEIVTFVRELPENKGLSDKDIVIGFETLQDVCDKYICKKRPPHGLVTTYLFGYEVDNPSADYLKYKVFCEPYGGTVNETYYTKNLKFAKAFFAGNLQSLYESEGIDGISALYRKLTLRLMFNIHEIDDDYDVFVAFETMNNRGKKLTNLELLKNRLIYLTTLYSDEKFDDKDKEELRKQINDAWKEVYYQLGRNENVPLSDDEFLRAHWITYFTYSRKKGDDYIKFLLRKFSAKNIFEKKTVLLEDGNGIDGSDLELDDEIDETNDTDTITVSKLEPMEISQYVNSLKDMAKYWYDTYFPYESTIMSAEEQRWVDRLNRIGIGYFRPLVTAILNRHTKTTEEKRIEAFKAIERFIFVCFRVGGFQATYCSSDYNRTARALYLGEQTLDEFIEDINGVVDNDYSYAISNFTTKIEKLFSNGSGFYGWGSIKYFMYEYEYSLAEQYGIEKIKWELFTKSEKDKVSIEHILPQTPTKHYWRNQFRQFTDAEIEQLSGALGNLLPLSQSVNSSLQNDSFYDKKSSNSSGRRGYENGSHSEILIAKEKDWDALRIYKRSKKLLKFLEERWNITIDKQEREKLIGVAFVNDDRDIPPEIKEDEIVTSSSNVTSASGDILEQQLAFWEGFVEYCNEQGRYDLSSRKPLGQNWYDVPVNAPDFIISYTLTYGKYISILIYAYDGEVFARLESKKDKIESVFGENLDWYSSREKSVAKRIILKKEANIYNPAESKGIYSWMIERFDKLQEALGAVNEKYE